MYANFAKGVAEKNGKIIITEFDLNLFCMQRCTVKLC